MMRGGLSIREVLTAYCSGIVSFEDAVTLLENDKEDYAYLMAADAAEAEGRWHDEVASLD